MTAYSSERISPPRDGGPALSAYDPTDMSQTTVPVAYSIITAFERGQNQDRVQYQAALAWYHNHASWGQQFVNFWGEPVVDTPAGPMFRLDVMAASMGPAAAAAAMEGVPTCGPEPITVDGAPSLNSEIAAVKQARHIKDTPQWSRTKGGYLTSLRDAQQVLDALHSGEAAVIGKTSNGHLVVRYNGVTGYNNNPGAGYLDQPTNLFIIKGTTNPSIVPTSPGAGR